MKTINQWSNLAMPFYDTRQLHRLLASRIIEEAKQNRAVMLGVEYDADGHLTSFGNEVLLALRDRAITMPEMAIVINCGAIVVEDTAYDEGDTDEGDDEEAVEG